MNAARYPRLAAVVLALWFGAGVAHAQTPEAAPPDSALEAPASPVLSIRAAYRNAWALRQAGDYASAIAVADSGSRAANVALSQDLNLTTRCAVTELKTKLAGLRDAARRDLASAATAAAQGNAPDDKVLNTPAIEDIEPQVNPDVLKWVEYFTGSGRSVFERWLKRSGRYVDLFRTVLKKEGLPPDLVHLVFVESGFNLYARSTSAAVGPWQFLRSTGRLFGLTVNQWVDERRDPEKATVAAARYLKHLYAIFGDWPLALASYNAGEGTVLRAIKRQGTTNYWDLRLPRQTEEYVPQFMAVLTISRDPEKYGFDSVVLDDPMEFDEVAFKGAIDLRALSKLADCTTEELKVLNPAVLKTSARGAGDVTTLRVPRGKGEVLMGRLQEGAKLPATDLALKHRVRRGETLEGLARQYHVSAQRLALENGIGRKRPLKRGMTLTIPASLSTGPALFEGDDPRARTAYVPERRIGTPAKLNAESDGEGRMTVTVKKGETLASIAERHGVTVDDLKRWNHLKTGTVKRGTRLKIRTGETAAAVAESTARDSAQVAQLKPPKSRKAAKAKKGSSGASGKTVVVRAGDTLSEIARRHGTSVSALRKANGLPSNQVRSGQRLKIPTG